MGNKRKVTKGEIKSKKIGFASAVLFVIGSSIGAGIFLKNGEVLSNVSGSVVLALISWILSIFAVICMGLSLVEITSASVNSDLGIVAWVKSFNHKFLYKVAKYFMAYLYIPINFFIMPYYLVMTLQEAIGWQTTWWISAFIAVAITIWLFFMSGLSSRAADITNKATTSVKFIPLGFCAIVGIVLACCGHCHVNEVAGYPTWLPQTWGVQTEGHHLLATLIPVLGIFGSIPAIIFSFDGFYAATGIQSQLEQPKKTPLALLIGLLIVSALDVLISISLLLGSKEGTVGSINWFTDSGNKWHIVISVIQILIAIGILSVLNSFSIYNPLFYEELVKNYELPFSRSLYKKLNPNKHTVGLIYSGVLSLIFFVVLTFIGAYGYMDVTGYGSTELIQIWNGATVTGYQETANPALNIGGNIHCLYSMADLMANWTAIFAFMCIVFALIGAYKNRRTKKVKVVQVKGFKFFTIVSSIIISIGIAFVVVSTFANIYLVLTWKADIGTEYKPEQWYADMLGVIMTLVMLIVFILVCTIPSAVEMKKEKGRPLNWQTWR